MKDLFGPTRSRYLCFASTLLEGHFGKLLLFNNQENPLPYEDRVTLHRIIKSRVVIIFNTNINVDKETLLTKNLLYQLLCSGGEVHTAYDFALLGVQIRRSLGLYEFIGFNGFVQAKCGTGFTFKGVCGLGVSRLQISEDGKYMIFSVATISEVDSYMLLMDRDQPRKVLQAGTQISLQVEY